MKIVCIGGGPAGLYFALLMKKQNANHDITVIERNKPFDTFGWGVVFSDQTLGNLEKADQKSAKEILASFNHWDDIEVRAHGEVSRSSGHGFCGIGRKRLLNILQNRCLEEGVSLLFDQDVTDDEAFKDADLIIACDGLNSRIRTKYEQSYKPNIDVRKCRFVWLGTTKLFEAFTFAFEKTHHGWYQAHCYQFDSELSTFIVETTEETWLQEGLDKFSKEESIAFCEKLFAQHLEGHALLSNAEHLRGSSQWIKFPRVICENWVHHNGHAPVVLMGDAAHTAHFSIGSGTKLALEDSIELAQCIANHQGNLTVALESYQALRSVEVLKIQNAARNSTEWFENVERYMHLPMQQFAYSLLTRSQRISHENLKLRDHKYVREFETWFSSKSGMQTSPSKTSIPPMFTPFKLRELTLKNRIVVSPMAQYSCTEGMPEDYHLVHLGARAMGGAALVMTEMTCISPQARITPGCPGIWNDSQAKAWQKIVNFVHENTDAKIGIQLGHSGAKGSTKLAWDGMDQPLDQDNWLLLSASKQQYVPQQSHWAQEITLRQMDQIKKEFVNSTVLAIEAGFDWLELHCAHGYLLSSFISPLTNHRTDEYGGDLKARLKYPLEVFKAMREVWPVDLPISVRISTHDWVEGGITPDDAVMIGKYFKIAGVDLIDCSSGQVSKDEKPVYGRMFQTPMSDRVRQEAQIPTIAVGAISDADQVNSIIASGRADLCAVARPHLANPHWTLNEAAKIGYFALDWPKPYQSGKFQLERNLEREKMLSQQSSSSLAVKARLNSEV
ncbi:MAG: bifunctional salicylyl-CoA 5-hydroxylase/oxidoreductase [Betaproteobacteria bacterium]|jgi:anthraniloyl-CoA monooxygenase